MTHPMLETAGTTMVEERPLTPGETFAQLPAVVQEQHRSLLPAPLDELKKAAFIIAHSMSAPVGLQGDATRCLAIAYQAALWNLDPVAVASKCYLVPVKGGGERLAYEAQLIKALINTWPKMKGRLRVKYQGSGSQRFASVMGYIRGEAEPFLYSSPIIGQISPKNSPLWIIDPDQQLDYYSCRAWGRRHATERIMGIYSPDEFEMITDVSPERVKADPFAEAPEIEAEFEPSGGREALNINASAGKTAVGGESGEKGTDAPEAGKKPPAAKSEPSGGKTQAESKELGELRAWAFGEHAAILALTDPEEIAARWNALSLEKKFRRLIAYDQDQANVIKRAIAARVKELSAGKAAKPAPTEPTPDDPSQ